MSIIPMFVGPLPGAPSVWEDHCDVYKLVPTAAQLPAQGKFVALDADGITLNSDWYLRLANEAGKMLRGEIPLQTAVPILPP